MKQISAFINSKLYLGAGLLAVGIFLNQFLSSAIKYKYGDSLPVLPDLLLDNLPLLNTCFVSDLILFLSICIFVYYALKHQATNLSYILVVFGLVQLARAISIFVTPIGSPTSLVTGCLFMVDSNFFGMFPSGHLSIVFTCYLLSQKRGYRILFSLLSVVLAASLIFGKGHYTIDIIAAVLYSYAIFVYSERNLKKKFENKK